MKKVGRIILGILVAIAGVLWIAVTLYTTKPHSYTIIGGADGPTSIFLAGKYGAGTIITAVIGGLVLAVAGFAMLNPYSNIEQEPDYSMAEFTIFPSYRRKHLTLETAKKILEKHPGKWEIKYNEKNSGAKKLWTTLAETYSPEIQRLNEEETVLVFEV